MIELVPKAFLGSVSVSDNYETGTMHIRCDETRVTIVLTKMELMEMPRQPLREYLHHLVNRGCYVVRKAK